MELSELNNRLKVALRSRIVDLDHIITGDMYKSIKFTSTDNKKLIIKFNSKYYIKYLDGGDFISDFFKLSSTKAIISKYIKEKLIKNVKKTI